MIFSGMRHIVYVSALLFSLPAHAYTQSIEVRAGAGEVGFPRTCAEHCTDTEVRGSYDQADVNFVFSSWTNADLYVGAEYTSADDLHQYFEGRIYNFMRYSLDASSAQFGIRYKLFPTKRVNLVLMVAALAGKAHYNADFSGQLNVISVSGNQTSAYFVRPRIGIGAVVRLSNGFGAGFEASFTKAFPSVNFTAVNTVSGQLESRRLNDNADMFGITLGFHYTF